MERGGGREWGYQGGLQGGGRTRWDAAGADMACGTRGFQVLATGGVWRPGRRTPHIPTEADRHGEGPLLPTF